MPEARNAQGMVEWIIWEMRKDATCGNESEFPIVACMSNTGPRCPSKAAGMVVTGQEVLSAYLLDFVLFWD
jgi:hypothetical protein